MTKTPKIYKVTFGKEPIKGKEVVRHVSRRVLASDAEDAIVKAKRCIEEKPEMRLYVSMVELIDSNLDD